MERDSLVRLLLGLLFLSTLTTGSVAAADPHVFYDDFPFVAQWVRLLPPYNEHLITDVGGLYLGFAVLFAWAGFTLQPTLIRATCSAWLVPAGLHLAFHATHLQGFSTADAISEVVSLAMMVAPAVVVLWAWGRPGIAERSEGQVS